MQLEKGPALMDKSAKFLIFVFWLLVYEYFVLPLLNCFYAFLLSLTVFVCSIFLKW